MLKSRKNLITIILVVVSTISFTFISIYKLIEIEVEPPTVSSALVEPKIEGIVTGMCTFGDCPVIKSSVSSKESSEVLETSKELITDSSNKSYDYENEDFNVTESPDYYELNITEEYMTPTTNEEVLELYYEDINIEENINSDRLIGTMYVTGYTSEEGFYEGSPTASGIGAGPGTCALNSSQMKSLGIEYGDKIRIEGLGIYTVTNCGCGWGVVDIWLYTNAEAYEITGEYEVYFL